MQRFFFLCCAFVIPCFYGCTRTYHHFQVALNPSLYGSLATASLAIKYSAGNIKDSVLIFPIDNGQIISSQSNGGISGYFRSDWVGIRLFSFSPTSSQQDYSSLLGTNESVQKVSVWIDNNLLYNADFTREVARKADVIIENISFAKSSTELLGSIPLGFDSTEYTLSLYNKSKDTCFILYSTPMQQNISTTLRAFSKINLYGFVAVDSRLNKDVGDALKNYVPEITVHRKDSLGRDTTVYKRSPQQPTMRSEWQYTYTLPIFLNSYTNRLPQASYILEIP
jgi:hypothetical protein